MQPFHRRLIYALLLAAGLVWIWVSADRSGASTAGRIPAPRQDFLAPDFTLQTLTGESVRLSDLRGQAVLVNLWATWCPPCRAELPELEAAHERYAGQVIVVGVNQMEPAANVAAFAGQIGLAFPLPLDAQGDVSRQYAVRSLPTTFFVDREGVIRRIQTGALTEATLAQALKTIFP